MSLNLFDDVPMGHSSSMHTGSKYLHIIVLAVYPKLDKL